MTAVYTHRELRSSVQQSLAGVGQEPAPTVRLLPLLLVLGVAPLCPASRLLGFVSLSVPCAWKLACPRRLLCVVQQREYHPSACWKRSFWSSISGLLSQTPWGGACSLGCKKPPRRLGCMLKSWLWWILVWKRSAYEEIRIHLRKWAPGSSRSLTRPRTN